MGVIDLKRKKGRKVVSLSVLSFVNSIYFHLNLIVTNGLSDDRCAP